ncbi:MAG: DivIVA domain-containing protein [bacterium]
MNLTPLDIQQQKFKTKLRGYDPKEVDYFLEIVAKEIEQLIRDKNQLTEELQHYKDRTRELKERESSLQNILLTAQQVTEEIKINAKKDADLIIKQAQLEAESIIEKAKYKLSRTQDDLIELQRQKDCFEARLRGAIETHLNLLNLSNKNDGPLNV